MKYQSIGEILEMIGGCHDRFERSVAGLTPEQENFRPAPDRWTIAENAEHVAIVNGGFVRLAAKLLKQAEAEQITARAGLEVSPLTMTDDGALKPGKWQAPEMVRPKGGMSVSDALAAGRQAIVDLTALKERLDAVDLTDKKWPHPLLGELNVYQLLVLFGEHEERHRLQIEEIRSSAGFP